MLDVRYGRTTRPYGNFFKPGYEGHTRRLLTSGDWVESEKTIPAGTYVVTTSQRNGMLAAVLLEPESNDGLASWNYFDTGIAGRKASRVYPVKKSLTDYRLLCNTRTQCP